MSPRGKRVAFGLFFIVVGTAASLPMLLLFSSFWWLGVLCECAVLGVGGTIAFTAPPASYVVENVAPPAPAAPPLPMSTYRGAMPPRTPALAVTKASAKRITLGILAALVFTGAAVPFATHLPRWIEAEIVVVAWWAIWSVVLAVVAYRGAAVEDDHRPGKTKGSIVELGKPKWSSLLDGANIADGEGCVIAIAVLLVLGLALLGAWLVVELVAPAVFVVAYRGVVGALARARAAKTHGDALRSALTAMGWAAVYTAPLAALVALAHVLFSASG